MTSLSLIRDGGTSPIPIAETWRGSGTTSRPHVSESLSHMTDIDFDKMPDPDLLDLASTTYATLMGETGWSAARKELLATWRACLVEMDTRKIVFVAKGGEA